MLLITVSTKGKIVGGVVYFGDMAHYGSGGVATQKKTLLVLGYWPFIQLVVVRE